MVRIGLIGDFDTQVVAHNAIPTALHLAAKELQLSVEHEWLATPSLENTYTETLQTYQALWAVPGTPYASMTGALNAIHFARKHKIPLLGTCGGFQHMLIEYARNVLHLSEADHAESNPEASILLVAPLTCSLNNQTHTFTLIPTSLVANIYTTETVIEQHGLCNYGLNPEFSSLFTKNGLHISGVDEQGEARIVELEDHPFFIGTLFQPERSALHNKVHPLIVRFLAEAHKSKNFRS